MGALLRWRFRLERDGKGVFCAQDDRRLAGCAAHAACARSGARAWRGGAEQCLHAHSACVVRPNPMARDASDPGRDGSPAALVSHSYLQNVLLGSYGSRAPARTRGVEASGAQSAQGAHRGTLGTECETCEVARATPVSLVGGIFSWSRYCFEMD